MPAIFMRTKGLSAELCRFIAEKVIHHPTVIAAHCEGRKWVFEGDADVKSKFWGRSIELHPEGGSALLLVSAAPNLNLHVLVVY